MKRPVREMEYVPLDRTEPEPDHKNGFLTWLVRRVFGEKTCPRCGSSFSTSSGEEVEEEVIEF